MKTQKNVKGETSQQNQTSQKLSQLTLIISTQHQLPTIIQTKWRETKEVFQLDDINWTK